nr:unnamed protein product [Spirometra erinaceieuropaei]
MDLFSAACEKFGLVIDTETTVVMHQPPPDAAYAALQINMNGAQLEHKLAIRRRDLLSALDCGHRLIWDGAEVVAMANTKQARKFLEAWQSGRCLGTRINEHKLAIRRRDPLSLVFAHALEYDHRFNWDGTEVVAMANTKRAREFLEAWYSHAGSINRHVDINAHYEGLRSRMTAPCPNDASTIANTAARIPTDSPPTLPLQHGAP